MIKFSVIIPLYNKEKEIIDTLNSVLNQSHKADEIIVVDDGSTDEAVKKIKETFNENIKIINQENQGVSFARNRGIEEAQNEYICLIDGDDLWELGFLAEIAKLIELFPRATFYSTAHKYVDERGKKIKEALSFNEEFQGLIENFVEVFRKNYALVNSSSVCIRKSVDILFPTGEKRGEDICVWLALSLQGNLAFSAKPLSIYRLDASNRSASMHKESVVPCPIKWFYENKQELKKEKNYQSIKKFIYSNIFITVYGGFALGGDYGSIGAVIKLMKVQKDYFYLLLYPAYLMPVKVLEFVKKIRRSMR